MAKVLITGASRGLGFACAQKFAAEGHKVYGIARRFEKKFPGTNIVADVADGNLGGKIAKLGAIDCCVNNAGIFAAGSFSALESLLLQQMWSTNVTGFRNVLKSVLPGMLAARKGRIFNIGSIAGNVVFPGFEEYCATKRTAHEVTRILQQEVASSNVQVSLVVFCFAKTNILDYMPQDMKSGFEQFRAKQGSNLLEPDFIASEIYKAFSAEKLPAELRLGSFEIVS